MRENILHRHADVILNTLNNNIENIVAVFDSELNWLLVNEPACVLLRKEKHELEGSNLLHLFPSLTASKSHRHLLQALSGEEVRNAMSEGSFTKEGAVYESSYFPLKNKDKVEAIIAVTRICYYP